MGAEEVAARAEAGRRKVRADVDEVCERIWKSRREVYSRLGLWLDRMEAVHAAVGTELWISLMAFGDFEHPYSVMKTMEVVTGPEPEWVVRVFDLRCKHDPHVGDRDIIIRGEVVA